MSGESRVSVTIVNRIYPPGSGITGEAAAELAEHLISCGLSVHIVHVDAKYKGGAKRQRPVGNVYKVRTFYNGGFKYLRLLSSLWEGYRLIKLAQRLHTDIVICMTDPPLLNFWASLMLKNKTRWIYWSMDLYPEAFLADGLIKPGNLFYRFVNNIIKRNSPDYLIALGENQAEYLYQKFQRPIPTTILPCGVFTDSQIDVYPPYWLEQDKIVFGYIGNLGAAHSSEFIRFIIDSIDSDRHQFVLSIYGTQAQEIIEFAKTKKGVVVLPHVKRQELKFIDVHLATLVEEWNNVCVPSKTVSAVCAGSSFIYFGPEKSDNWSMLKHAGWRVEDLNFHDIKTFIGTLDNDKIKSKRCSARVLTHSLIEAKENSFKEISGYITNLRV